jgi:hypothetical protein
MSYQTKICPYCQSPQIADSRFCSNCANSLDSSAHSYLTSKRSIIIITALGTTVAFLLGVFLLATYNSKPTVNKSATLVSDANNSNSLPTEFSKSPEPPKTNQITITKTAPQNTLTAEPKSESVTAVDLKIKGNKNSMIYHLPRCASYDRIAERNIEWFKTTEEAESAGYRMARNC